MMVMIGRELLQFLKKSYPVLIILSLAVIIAYTAKPENTKTTGEFSIGIVDEDKTIYSRVITGYLKGHEGINNFAAVTTGNREEIKEAFDRGELDGYLIIPKGFIKDLMKLNDTSILVVLSPENEAFHMLIANVLGGYEKYIMEVGRNCQALYQLMELEGYSSEECREANDAISVELILSMFSREDMFQYEMVKNTKKLPPVTYYVFSVLGVCILYGGLINASGIVKEHKNGMFTRIRVQGVNAASYLTAKTLAGLIKTGSILLPLILFLSKLAEIHVTAAGIFKVLLIVAVVCLIWNLIFYLGACVLYADELERFFSVGIFYSFFSVILGGGLIPLQYLPQTLIMVAKCTPFYWILQILCRL